MNRAVLVLLVILMVVPTVAWSATVAGGSNHTVVLKTTDGTVWCWGANGSGQLGDNSNTQRKTPVQAGTLTGVTAVAAGANHTLALKSDSTVWAWGANGSGQLGDNSSTPRNAPVQVLVSATPTTALSGIIAIAAGDNHSVALKNDGSVWTWGENGLGQLATGGTADRSLAAAVAGLSGIVAIGAGGDHTLVVTNAFGNPMKSWGKNSNGQLGDGTTTSPALNPAPRAS